MLSAAIALPSGILSRGDLLLAVLIGCWLAVGQGALGQEQHDDFVYQGEYVGERAAEAGPAEKWGLQVVAHGGGQFRGLAYQGGLLGDGWIGDAPRELSGAREGDLLRLETSEGQDDLPECTEYFELDGQAAYLYDCTGEPLATLEKVHRESPTLGAAPPEGARVLAGEGVDYEAVWDRPRLTEEGYLREGVVSQEPMGGCRLHLEYQMPYRPGSRGQNRGNSGVYVQSRYEVQLLDSFGLVPGKWDCAAVYSYRAPSVNMCLPPGAWQTLDIEFTPARFYASGERCAPAVITVRHNGVVVHEEYEIPGKTGYGQQEGPQPLPLRLQDHGSPIQFRNIWLEETEPIDAGLVADPLEALFAEEDD